MTLILAYVFDPRFIVKELPALAAGLRLTVEVSVIGMLGALLAGVLGAAACELRVPFLRRLVPAYVEFFRNTPLLVQIFFLYFALPNIGIKLSAFTVAGLSLILWGGAYNVENVRAGFDAVERGYREGARALGLGPWQAFVAVVLPVGLRTALPSVTNTLVSVLKNSSFMVAIGFPELTDTAVNIVALTFRVFEMFLAIGAVYLVLVWLLSLIMQLVERRLALPGAR
ncbi:MAG: amino acid ABC transporter permease [bacterium]|nr:amino acid ABC transporter permease [bacterium]